MFPAYPTYGPLAAQYHCSYHYDTSIFLTYITHWFVLAWLLFLDYLDLEIGGSNLLKNVSTYYQPTWHHIQKDC
jgi:hypothetical protein